MKVMILAAGRGERLKPITNTLPKPLVKVNNKSLIEYHIEYFASIGIKEIIVNVSWLADLIIEQLGNGSKWGVTISYSYENEALETAGGIKKALPLLGNEPFLVINGDIFIDVYPTIPELKSGVMAHIWLVDNPKHNLGGDFHLHDTQVLELGRDKLTFAGIGLYDPNIFKELSRDVSALGGLLRKIIPQGLVTGSHLKSFWCDVGTLARLNMLIRCKSNK